MKKILSIIVFLLAISQVQAQTLDLPSIASNGFAFPIGTKFTIKLVATDSVNYDYSVIAFEAFNEIADSWNNDHLFPNEGEEGTIMFCFCLGTHGETEQEKEQNMKVLLLMKNYTKQKLNYTSDIQRLEDGEFEPTSNIGTYPGAKGKEIWPYMIYTIALSEFRKMKI